MKICFIANADSIHTFRWLKPLASGDIKLTLFSDRPTERIYPNTELIDLSSISNLRVLRFLIWATKIRSWIKENHPDILHVHQAVGPGWLGWLSGFHPFIVSAWGSDLLLEPDKSVLRNLLLRRVLQTCDRLIVPNDFLFQQALSLNVAPSKVVLIPWDLDTKIFFPDLDGKKAARTNLGLPEEGTLILAPRSISALYNIDTIIQAYHMILEKITNLRLVLIKNNIDTIYYQVILEQISNLHMSEQVIWLPKQQNPQDMANVYRAADVCISIPQSESYGVSVYEAMACGCPTVITDLPAFRNLVHRNHTLKVPPRDAVATSVALLDILEDPNLKERLIKAGIVYEAQYTTTSQYHQSLKLYEELGLKDK